MNTIELLTHLARRYKDVKQPGYPYNRKLALLEKKEMLQGEAIKFKKRVVKVALEGK